MRVKFLDNTLNDTFFPVHDLLTVNKEYEVLSITASCYVLQDDTGQQRHFFHEHFEELEERPALSGDATQELIEVLKDDFPLKAAIKFHLAAETLTVEALSQVDWLAVKNWLARES